MSRLSRTDAAKSVIAVWRWLHAHPDAPSIEGNVPDLFAALGNVGNVAAVNGMSDRLKLMEHLGLIRQEQRHEQSTTAAGKPYPRTYTTTFIAERDVEKGARKLGQHFAQGGFLKMSAKGNQKLKEQATVFAGNAPSVVNTERVAIRTNEKNEPVEAVVGEDAPTIGEGLAQMGNTTLIDRVREARKPTDAEAFIAAARQYDNRNDFVIAKLKEIEALGVVIDREKVLKGIDLQRDDELEGVVKVLPYIDDLEAQAGQIDEWRNQVISLRNEIKEVRRERDAARADARRQQEANERIVARHLQSTVSKPQVLVGEA